MASNKIRYVRVYYIIVYPIAKTEFLTLLPEQAVVKTSCTDLVRIVKAQDLTGLFDFYILFCRLFRMFLEIKGARCLSCIVLTREVSDSIRLEIERDIHRRIYPGQLPVKCRKKLKLVRDCQKIHRDLEKELKHGNMSASKANAAQFRWDRPHDSWRC